MSGGADEFDTAASHLIKSLGCGFRGDPGGQVHQNTGGETGAYGVLRGRPDAVVGGDADDIHLIDSARAQPVGQSQPVGGAFETAVGGGVGTFGEDRFNTRGIEVWVEIRAYGTRDAMPGPR